MPELGIVGWDVPSIVILTLHLLWRTLITEVTYLPHTYLRNDLCGTGADKPTVESEPCTDIRY